MLRYRLDDLGWYHFEHLVQALLKADLGLAVQSWAGHDDNGCDAYSAVSLRFPDRNSATPGPFVFQIKFVQAANAPGAKWKESLLQAVRSEITRIEERRRRRVWLEPAHYVFLTNCPLTAATRRDLAARLSVSLPAATVTPLGGTDVCSILDNHPELRRSFPEILSLRDLDELLADSVNRRIVTRSKAAIEETRDLVPVFVPTRAYDRAWQVLQQHCFVVLDGPPEMGKTAIARTIALAQLLSGWHAVDCRGPDDFFSLFDARYRQIFVADDAFGRTEYDPSLGRRWERDLPRVFQFLDARHYLVRTTRRHILMRALREMDLTGKAGRFPDPAEVIVTADDLTLEEKARILYRHARASHSGPRGRQIVREAAPGIAADAHFTPERIRRFVQEVLPSLASPRGDDKPEAIARAIREAINDPTERMQKAFRKLPDSHRWLLIAFLEFNGSVVPASIKEAFIRHRPKLARSFDEALDDLVGTFLKIGPGRYSWEGPRADWIHPSYRDLVIDELTVNSELQLAFLRGISASGVKVVLSLSGGTVGQRQMPLMTTFEGWSTLHERCREIAEEGDDHAIAVLCDVLSGTLGSTDVKGEEIAEHVERSLRSVAEISVAKWDASGGGIGLEALLSFHAAIADLLPRPPLPNIRPTWEQMTEQLLDVLKAGFTFEPDAVDRWVNLGLIIEAHYPAVASSSEYRELHDATEQRLFGLAEEAIEAGADLQDGESNEAEGQRLEEFAGVLTRLDVSGSSEAVVGELLSVAREYRENGPEEERGDDYEPPEPADSVEPFDVAALFEDL